MVIDSYAEFAERFDMKELYRFGLEHTIFAAPKVADTQTEEMWEMWTQNKWLSIRESVRSGKFKSFYKSGCGKDVTEKKNNVPFREKLEKATGFDKKKGNTNKLNNFQCTHVFGRVSNPILVCSVWNMVFSPNIVAAMTDVGNMSLGKFAEEYQALLMGVVWKLYENIIKDYDSNTRTILQNIKAAGYKVLSKKEVVEEWLIPNKDDVLLKYEALCWKMGIRPDFVRLPLETDDKEINAIRIVFHSEN